MAQTNAEWLDELTGVWNRHEDRTFTEDEIDDVSRQLRRLNREIWGLIDTVEALYPIDVRRFMAELEDGVPVETLLEAGVLRIDRRAWNKWVKR